MTASLARAAVGTLLLERAIGLPPLSAGTGSLLGEPRSVPWLDSLRKSHFDWMPLEWYGHRIGHVPSGHIALLSVLASDNRLWLTLSREESRGANLLLTLRLRSGRTQ